MKYPDRKGHAPSKVIPLSRHIFDQIRLFIRDKTGIYFQDNKQYLLQSRLKTRLTQLNMDSFDAYYEYLNHPANRAELGRMISAITINETYFFRSQEQFNSIQNTVLPRLIEQKQDVPDPVIKIWSTACSTGDEPYTLALIVNHYFRKRYPRYHFEILASDIDADVIAKAQKGLYSTYAVRNIPPHLLKAYFSKINDVFQISDEIRQMVTFKKINLSDRLEMIRIHGIDLAICANVLIYFPGEIRENVVNSIYNCLNTSGYFMVGFSETLFGIDHPFTPLRDGKNTTYQKL